MHNMIAEQMLFFNILNPSKYDFSRRHHAFADILGLDGTDFYYIVVTLLFFFFPYSLSRFVLFLFFPCLPLALALFLMLALLFQPLERWCLFA